MKRRVWAYALTSVAIAVTLAGGVVAFCYALPAVGAILSALTLMSVFCLAGEIVQDNFCIKSEKLFLANEFEEEKQLLDKVRRNHLLFPFVRERFFLSGIRNAVARDDLPLAKSYIMSLRHGGERSNKYKTSYATVLILLDEGNVKGAREEYEDFRIHNEHYELYKPQIEMLNALFARLFSRSDVPLPESAVNTRYPVIKRILGRHFEAQTDNTKEEWGE